MTGISVFTKGLNFSNFISSGGKNRKSAIKAIAKVIAVSFAIFPFIENAENDNMVNPITRINEVTISALPTVLKA